MKPEPLAPQLVAHAVRVATFLVLAPIALAVGLVRRLGRRWRALQ